MHLHKKFQVNRTKIKGGCQSETKAAQTNSCIELTLIKTELKIKLVMTAQNQNVYDLTLTFDEKCVVVAYFTTQVSK